MTEIYKDIKDLEGLYQVSNFGNIMSLNYNRTGKPKLLKPGKDKHGYLRVNLWKDGKRYYFQIHRLVAQTFLPNPENKPCINHKIEGDEGRKLNIVYINEDGSVDEKKSTIEWVTAKENCNYGTCIQRAAKARINGKLSKPVLQFTKSVDFIREWPSTKECGRNGFDQSAVWRCCQGKQKSAYGYIWKYKE